MGKPCIHAGSHGFEPFHGGVSVVNCPDLINPRTVKPMVLGGGENRSVFFGFI